MEIKSCVRFGLLGELGSRLMFAWPIDRRGHTNKNAVRRLRGLCDLRNFGYQYVLVVLPSVGREYDVEAVLRTPNTDEIWRRNLEGMGNHFLALKAHASKAGLSWR